MIWGDPNHPLVGKFALIGSRRKTAEIIGVCVLRTKGPVGGQVVERLHYRLRYLDSGAIKTYHAHEAQVEVIPSPLETLATLAE
jgi:hypothetical protein